jgi:hypothetical protein
MIIEPLGARREVHRSSIIYQKLLYFQQLIDFRRGRLEPEALTGFVQYGLAHGRHLATSSLGRLDTRG